MLVKYIGGRGPLYLPAVEIEVANGEVIEVPDEFGEGLLAQGSSVDEEGNATPGTEWAKAEGKSPKRAEKESEAQQAAP